MNDLDPLEVKLRNSFTRIEASWIEFDSSGLSWRTETAMLACPNCDKRLRRVKTGSGLVHVCSGCRGWMVSLSVLRQKRASRRFLQRIWVLAKTDEAQVGKQCAHCSRPMAEVEVQVAASGRDLVVDVCTLCMGVWLDPGEQVHLPREPRRTGEDDSGQLSAAAREAMATADVQRVGREAEERKASEGPEESWQYLPALLGLPVETSVPEIEDRPWITWGLTAFCVLVCLLLVLTDGLDGLRRATEAWGFIPAAWGRNGGLTVLASFVLHGGVWHILGNMYFFMVFGDNVEDDLGKWRFAGLLLLSHVAGLVAHGLVDRIVDRPVVGASAAISGVIAYYAVAFPGARLGLYYRYGYRHLQWLRIPVVVAFILWLFLHLMGAYEQVVGISNVSSAAHLGGAAVGFLAALCIRLQRSRARRGD